MQRAEFFHRSIIIVHTQCGQWQASLTQEKLAALTEVSDLQTPRNPGETESAKTVCITLPRARKRG